MSEGNNQDKKEDAERILIELRELFRGTAVGISVLAGLTPNVTTTTVLGMLVIVLWYTSTLFHPTKATVRNGTGEFDGNWFSIKGRFFGRPFEFSI